MFSEIIKKREEIINNWLKMVDIDLDEAELRYQFSKLFDDVVNLLEEETPKNIEEVVEDMSKYEIPPKVITESLIALLNLLEKENLNEVEILKLNKVIYSLSLKIYEEYEKERQKIISTQIETIKKMEIPILQLDSNTILVPLIGFIDSQKALNLMRKVLEKIRRDKTLNVIVDIEGIPVIDTEVAHQFVRLYRGVKAIGAKLVISGITPAVAETMVHLEIDLPIPTRATLELAIKAFKDEEI